MNSVYLGISFALILEMVKPGTEQSELCDSRVLGDLLTPCLTFQPRVVDI